MRRTRAILIVGGSGFVGTHLGMGLRDGYKVYAGYNTKRVSIPGVASFPMPVADRNELKRLVYNIQPDFVIYAAGDNNVERVEANDKIGDGIITRGCGSVLEVVDIFQPRFIVLSNSYVFDGQRGNYKENDPTVPRTSLGRYKVAAENHVKSHTLNQLIIRSSLLYGRGNGMAISFLDQVRRSLALGQTLKVKSDELHNFAPVSGLVDLVVRALETGMKNKVLHYGGLNKVTHSEFAQSYARAMGYNPKLIIPEGLISQGNTETNKEGILLDYSLNTTQTVTQLKFKPLLLEEGLNLIEKQLITGL